MDMLERFNTLWHVDFEYQQDANHLPVPISMCAIEQRTGRKIEMWRDELLRCRRAPFDVGDNAVMVAYMAAAELSCFEALGWTHPKNVLDLYVETIATINGDDDVGLADEKRPSLQEALQLYGLEPRMTKEEKGYWRNVILNNTDYTQDQKQGIRDYNRTDVEETLSLIERLAPAIEVPWALHRGRYMGAVARIENIALPISRPRLDRYLDHWDNIKQFYIKRDDTLGLYEDLNFRDWRLDALIQERCWNWPRTATGRPAMDFKTWRKQAQRHPELKTVSQLRTLISDLRIGALANTIGRDSRSRCSLKPFWTKTGRNQPSERDKIFLPALPAWIHGLIAPPPGYGMAEIDYSAQEILIMAALSGDQAMINDYMAGDPYLAYGIRAGLIPEDGTDKHPLRKPCKEVCLGMDYGMTAYGIRAKTGKTLMWSRDAHRRHRDVYRVFHSWVGDVVTTAKFSHRIESTYGWPMVVTDNTTRRALMNYMAQAGAGDMLRIALIAATEAGIAVCAPIHDAVWIMAPLPELDVTIERMREFMRRASMAVTGGYAARTKVEYVVRYPYCLGDVRKPDDRGQAMWTEVNALIDSGQLRMASYG
jgi:DNA polymerase I